MKILYFHQYFGTPQGSSGTRSYEMASALVRMNHEVTMVCGSSERSATGLTSAFKSGSRRGHVDGIEVIEFDLGYSNSDRMAKRAIKFLLFALRSARVAVRSSYDLAFSSSTPLTAGVPGIAAKLLRHKPFVFEVRDLWPELPRAMGMRNPLLLGGMAFLERVSYAAADKVVALAPGIADGIHRAGKPREDIALIPNGCDFALFNAAEPLHASALFSQQIAPQNFVAIFAGAHGKANGLDAVVDTAAALRRRKRADIKVLLVGGGSEKQRLQARANELGLTNLVFADALPKHTLASLLKGAGAGLQVLADVPAFYEGTSPNKFFDYLAASRPVVINYPGWLARLVTENDCGFAVPPGDAEAFADALVALADDCAGAHRKGRAAAALGRRMFSRELLAIELERVLLGVAGPMAGRKLPASAQSEALQPPIPWSRRS